MTEGVTLARLAELLTGALVIGDAETVLTGIQNHSRKVGPGDLFVCTPAIPGFLEDRHPFAADAVRAGAVALVIEREPPAPVAVPMIRVRDARYAMAVFAAHLYGCPSTELKLIGVTGTNGKTTTSCLLEAILSGNGYRTGQMGNLGTKIGTELLESDLNTQEPTSLQKNLRLMRDLSADYCVMEVSSQGIDTGRVVGCDFRTAVFTNLTQDHLDYHGSMEAYREAKGLLFARLGNAEHAGSGKQKFAVLNADDPASAYFRKLTTAQTFTYGFGAEADFRAVDVAMTAEGTSFRAITPFGQEAFRIRLLGRFNVYNALAAIAAAALEGIPLASIRKSLESVSDVNGRMELVREGQPFAVLVDYAHSPDGLESALSTIREFASGRIITVFGCGGNRDRSKRPVMGAIAARFSDRVIVTSDNPRKEDPLQIMRDIEAGIAEAGGSPEGHELAADRREAIGKAVRAAGPNDIVIIAGKGHETYQIIGDTTVHFDDREAAREAIRAL